MNIDAIKRKDGESPTDYKFRICRDRLSLGLDTWQKVADALNDEFDAEWGESKYRKWYYGFQEGVDYAKSFSDEEYLQEIKEQQIELQKEKIRYQDQKREYSNLIRQQARFEHMQEMIEQCVADIALKKPLSTVKKPINFSLKKKGIALWSDFHFGSKFENSFGCYNPDVFEARFKELLSQTIKYGKLNNIGQLTVANLGDAIAGLIHVGNRIQSSEDVVNQLMHIAEYMAEGLAILAREFDQIRFMNVMGNHSRCTPNKNESLFKENLERLIPWYLEARLSKFNNIEIINDSDGIIIDYVEDEPFVYVHGDLDQVSSAAKNIPQMLGIVPKYIFAGHIHHNTVKETGRTTVITNGCLSGLDDYAVSKRLYSEPMQKFFMLDGSNVECTYEIRFQ